MEFINNNKMFDFKQEFFETSSSDLVYTIHNIGVYLYTPKNLYANEDTEYFALVANCGDMAILGINWSLIDDGKLYNIKTRMMITQGDPEMMGYVQDEVVKRLVELKIMEKKMQKIILEGKDAES